MGSPSVLLPIAHLGHWLWVFYVIPVLIVVGGIFYSSRAEKQREREEGEGPTTKRRPKSRR